MTPNPHQGSGSSGFAGCSGRGSGWAAGGLVVAIGVEGEFAEEFPGGGVDDADVQVADEHEDAGSGVGPADADVVEAAGVAEGEFAVGDRRGRRGPGRGRWCRAGRGWLWAGGVDGGGGGPVGQGSVRPLIVVDHGEGIEEGLQPGDGGGLAGLGEISTSSSYSFAAWADSPGESLVTAMSARFQTLPTLLPSNEIGTVAERRVPGFAARASQTAESSATFSAGDRRSECLPATAGLMGFSEPEAQI
jgi:hypothetical protein